LERASTRRVASVAFRWRRCDRCSRDGFYSLDFGTGACELFAAARPLEDGTRINDGKVDPRGRFIAGGVDDSESRPICELYRLDPNASVTPIAGHITVTNGPCWSLDGRIFYVADSWLRTIFAYDYDLERGTVGPPRVWASTEDLTGIPDGATVDVDGCLWSALVYGGQLARFRPDGYIDRLIDMPVKNITSVAFGGPNLDRLYVTSMGRAINGVAPSEKEAGAIFVVTGLGTSGVPEPRFAG
jgi:L-arabinonolactonase